MTRLINLIIIVLMILSQKLKMATNNSCHFNSFY